MKRILLINGHPDKESYNFALSNAYLKGALISKAKIQVINIRELKFNPNLQYGYRNRTELEPDLIEAQNKMKWATHIVWFYPVWWGSVPAIMKGFLDRTLLPGFAFEKKSNSLWWNKLFTDKTAHLICTLDQPSWYYKWFYKCPSHYAMRKLTLNFIGISRVKTTTIGPLRLSSKNFREKWLKKIELFGMKNK